ncbi:response regulator transcription factor [Flavihumibacter rivuli]|uniref:LytR/AlgR family response regulator transcription factor n=1 Tax=Flavihumibacter rivuli TaxID=2838156 RepID=UPI001BDEE002|nr:response regulator transcription factor [Flavihumibacter rivuli]ULQ54918.1 response regulator transcription factor [Flavihumibacter rivuli]
MQQKIRCVITDDEPLARKGLSKYVGQFDCLQLVGTCENVYELTALLRKEAVDLLFLDIEMPYVSGLEFAAGNEDGPKVIFTTAYEQYALKGYELDVLDYLLKPISLERFSKAVQKAKEYFELVWEKKGDSLFVKVGNSLEKVEISSILFLEARENYVAIQLKDRMVLTLSTLKGLREKLPVEKFTQVHKSFVVAQAKIDRIDHRQLHIGEHIIPLSKNFIQDPGSLLHE